MRRQSLICAVVAALLLEGVQAAFVSVDDPTYGTGAFTGDPGTGLEWLDITQALNRSYNDVSAQLGPGGEFEGLRYATREDLVTLLDNFFAESIVMSPANQVVDFQRATEFFGLFGSAFLAGSVPQGDIVRAQGFTSPGFYVGSSLYVHYPPLLAYPNESSPTAFINFQHNTNQLDTPLPYIGHWLVRENVVIPAPASFILFATAFSAISVAARKRCARPLMGRK